MQVNDELLPLTSNAVRLALLPFFTFMLANALLLMTLIKVRAELADKSRLVNWPPLHTKKLNAVFADKLIVCICVLLMVKLLNKVFCVRLSAVSGLDAQFNNARPVQLVTSNVASEFARQLS
jgi:hypothetical protein